VALATAANNAASIADEAISLTTGLDRSMEVVRLMSGQISGTFWNGHGLQLEAMRALSAKLHELADRVGDAKTAYLAADADGEALLKKAGNPGHVIDTNVLV
jgi:hypothetical protein